MENFGGAGKPTIHSTLHTAHCTQTLTHTTGRTPSTLSLNMWTTAAKLAKQRTTPQGVQPHPPSFGAVHCSRPDQGPIDGRGAGVSLGAPHGVVGLGGAVGGGLRGDVVPFMGLAAEAVARMRSLHGIPSPPPSQPMGSGLNPPFLSSLPDSFPSPFRLHTLSTHLQASICVAHVPQPNKRQRCHGTRFCCGRPLLAWPDCGCRSFVLQKACDFGSRPMTVCHSKSGAWKLFFCGN